MNTIATIIGIVFFIGVVVLYFWTPKWLEELGSAAAYPMKKDSYCKNRR